MAEPRSRELRTQSARGAVRPGALRGRKSGCSSHARCPASHCFLSERRWGQHTCGSCSAQAPPPPVTL